ncbi:MAG TPA: DUF2279 domain-containing protein [Ignavibacteriales bacterium]|nr:DUF2279 domain-containing protein [Ignavibacteriales bacterium]
MKLFFLFSAFIFFTFDIFPQDSLLASAAMQKKEITLLSVDSSKIYSSSSINWAKTGIIGGSIALVNGGLWLYYKEAWYSGDRTKWHVYDDWYNGNLNIDKLGHFHWAITQNKIAYRLLKWADFTDSQAMWYGSAIGWLLHLQIEMEDARYAEWGFSWGDLASNTVGQIYPNLQRIYPELNAVNIKMSYHPSPNYRDGVTDHLVNDYEGRTYWLTINLHSIAPKSIDNVIPDWLNLAVGYGGDKLVWPNGHLRQDNNEGIGEQEWYIALDYNLLKIFKPRKDSLWYILLEQLDGIHFPAPAIRIKPDAIYYGIYF